MQGVGDKPEEQTRLPELWAEHGLTVVRQEIDWTKSDYEQRLEAIGFKIGRLSAEGRVSLVGASGGGKAALSLLARYPDNVHRVVTINSKVDPYDLNEKDREIYKNLVISSDMLPQDLEKLYGMPPEVLTRILCMRTLGDKTVKPEEAVVNGAKTFTIEVSGSAETKLHIAGIAQAITKHSVVIADHIHQD